MVGIVRQNRLYLRLAQHGHGNGKGGKRGACIPATPRWIPHEQQSAADPLKHCATSHAHPQAKDVSLAVVGLGARHLLQGCGSA